MSKFEYIVFLLFLYSCTSGKSELTKYGEISFRNTLNLHRELTDAELDSLQKCKPTYRGPEKGNHLYDLLIQKGIVSGLELDTSTLNLIPISMEAPIVEHSGLIFNLETNYQTGQQYLDINKVDQTFKIDLGKRSIFDKWISLIDIDSNNKFEILVLEKYYVMGGDNYDLIFYNFE